MRFFTYLSELYKQRVAIRKADKLHKLTNRQFFVIRNKQGEFKVLYNHLSKANGITYLKMFQIAF